MWLILPMQLEKTFAYRKEMAYTYFTNTFCKAGYRPVSVFKHGGSVSISVQETMVQYV